MHIHFEDITMVLAVGQCISQFYQKDFVAVKL